MENDEITNEEVPKTGFLGIRDDWVEPNYFD